MNLNSPLSLFSAFGIEAEYMIVHQDTLNVLPIADRLFHDISERYANEIENGDISYSNELALHVIELKTSGPSKNLDVLPYLFHQHICHINRLLAKYQAKLLPTGAHPWMNPNKEFKLWPHGYNEIYESYHQIFDCRGHGWSNLQSIHLNLPFGNEEEFVKLHAAIRPILPIMPALSASSPIIDSKPTGYLDTRLFFYGQNQKKIPIIAGDIIPEIILSKKEYHEKILQKIYQAIKPYDPKNILQHEWLNSRGAIARFDRDAIEVRLLDTQECPLADVAIVALIIVTLQNLLNENWGSYEKLLHYPTENLKEIYLGSIKEGLSYKITDQTYLKLFGCNKSFCTAKELWMHILNHLNRPKFAFDQKFLTVINTILSQGNLSERILKALKGNYSKANLLNTYQKLADCLKYNKIF